MRRLLQTGTLFLLLTTVLAPLLEFFDRWDPAAPWNDTEFAVFLLVLTLALVLLVAFLLSRLAQRIGLIAHRLLHPPPSPRSATEPHPTLLFRPPDLSPPLRI